MRLLVRPLILFVLFSCSDSPEASESDPFSGFYPLQVGAFQLYDVEDIAIQQNVETRSVYELKVIVADSFRNEEEGYTYIINRYKRTDSTQSWTTLETWSVRKSNRQLIVNEGNIPYVRMIAPLTKGQNWNGNEFNTVGGEDACGDSDSTFSCDQYEMNEIGEAFQAGSISFENTLTVIEENDPDILVKNDVRKKVYSEGIGLVYIENTVLNYCTTPPSCYGTQFVNTGIIYKQTWKQSGVEK